MYTWFECKIKYEKEIGEGKTAKQSEVYLVDALNFTEAEKRIIKEMKPFMRRKALRSRWHRLLWSMPRISETP